VSSMGVFFAVRLIDEERLLSFLKTVSEMRADLHNVEKSQSSFLGFL